MCALVPILLLRKANIPRRDKVSAACLLALGCISSLCSLVRYPYVKGLNLRESLFPSVAIGLVSLVELGLGITTASLATLRPLLGSLLQSRSSDSAAPRTPQLGGLFPEENGQDAATGRERDDSSVASNGGAAQSSQSKSQMSTMITVHGADDDTLEKGLQLQQTSSAPSHDELRPEK